MTTFSLREATVHDLAFVYQLRNDVAARAGQTNMNPVSVAEISKWKPLIFYLDNSRIGYGLCDEIRPQECELAWNVAQPFRNRGYGRELIKLLIEHAGERDVVAFTKVSDGASEKAAAHAGLVKKGEPRKGIQAWGLDAAQPSGV